MSPEVMRSWKIIAKINRLLATPMSSSRKRRVGSQMHDGEDEEEEEEVEKEVLEAGGGVGKLVESESCDLSERGMWMVFLRAVPRRGTTGTA